MTEGGGRRSENSLDVLEQENIALRQCFAEIKSHRGSSIEERYKYGGLAKTITRHISLRQSSLMDVGFCIRNNSDLGFVADRMLDRAIGRRMQIDKVGKMSRNIQGMYLNTGQDFDGALAPLMDAISEEIDWELSEAIPLIRETEASDAAPYPFRSAHYIRRHARMELNPAGRQWVEYAPIISRVLTMFDHFKDHPRASAHNVRTPSS